eukprot:864179-Alexandrium_andersonii.AAC.1
MSASLVGSEMCIRDRPPTHDLPTEVLLRRSASSLERSLGLELKGHLAQVEVVALRLALGITFQALFELSNFGPPLLSRRIAPCRAHLPGLPGDRQRVRQPRELLEHVLVHSAGCKGLSRRALFWHRGLGKER